MIFKINSDLEISCRQDDEIYNVEHGKVFLRNLYNFDKPREVLRVEEEVVGIYKIGDPLILLSPNSVSFFLDGKLVRKEVFPGIIMSHRMHKDSLLILAPDPFIINSPSCVLSPVHVHSSSDSSTLKDLCVGGDKSFFLTHQGLVYKTSSILLRDSVLLHKPMKIIPEPDSSPEAIYFSDNKLFLTYPDGVEVYSIHHDILFLLYRYNTEYYKIVEEGGSIYCLDGTVNLLGNYPKVVLSSQVKHMLGNACISKDRLHILPHEEKDQLQGISRPVEGSGVENKLIRLFSDLRSEFIIPAEGEEGRILKDFDRKVLDNYRKFFLELSTANDSILEKKKKLGKLEQILVQKSVQIEDKRKALLGRMEKAMGAYKEILGSLKIDGSTIKTYIQTLEGNFSSKRSLGSYKRTLVAQRNLLLEKLQK